MRRFVADTRLVLEWSRETQHLVLLSIVGPALVFALGAACVASITLFEPFGPLESGALRNMVHLSILAACSVWMSTTAMAGKEFWRARRRIFGAACRRITASNDAGARQLQACLNFFWRRLRLTSAGTQA